MQLRLVGGLAKGEAGTGGSLGSQKGVGTLGILLTLKPETVLGNIPDESAAFPPPGCHLNRKLCYCVSMSSEAQRDQEYQLPALGRERAAVGPWDRGTGHTQPAFSVGANTFHG